jgi:hypothetical protein
MKARNTENTLGLARHCDVLLFAANHSTELRLWSNRACLAAGISEYLSARLATALLAGVSPVVSGRIEAVNPVALDVPFTLDARSHPECEAYGTAG